MIEAWEVSADFDKAGRCCKKGEVVKFSGSLAASIFRVFICETIIVVFTTVSEIPQAVLPETHNLESRSPKPVLVP
jgi:hypothetical protein